MDIAAAFPAKPPERPAASLRAPDTDPQADDFAAELDAAANAGKPQETNKPEGPSKKSQKSQTDLSAGDTPKAGDTGSADGLAAGTAQPQPEPTTQALGGIPQAALKTVADASTAATQTTTAQAAPVQPQAQANAGQGISAEAMTAMAAVAQPQSIAASAEHLSIPKPAAGGAKKPGASKPDAAVAPQPTAQTTTAQTSPAATPPVHAEGKANNPQNGADERQGQTVSAAQATSAQAPAPHAHEFKLDASAAATAMQPASPAVQNAPTGAPALIAQNAPVFVPPEALGVAIARKALEGVNKFELRLDPPEMGRLDVTLEVDSAGNTRAHIRAERPEALELLQREAKGMEQALRQAGLTLDQSSLSFSLSGREGREAQEHQHQGRRAKFNAVLPEDEIHAAIIRGSAPSTSGVDLRV